MDWLWQSSFGTPCSFPWLLLAFGNMQYIQILPILTSTSLWSSIQKWGVDWYANLSPMSIYHEKNNFHYHLFHMSTAFQTTAVRYHFICCNPCFFLHYSKASILSRPLKCSATHSSHLLAYCDCKQVTDQLKICYVINLYYLTNCHQS